MHLLRQLTPFAFASNNTGFGGSNAGSNGGSNGGFTFGTGGNTVFGNSMNNNSAFGSGNSTGFGSTGFTFGSVTNGTAGWGSDAFEETTIILGFPLVAEVLQGLAIRPVDSVAMEIVQMLALV